MMLGRNDGDDDDGDDDDGSESVSLCGTDRNDGLRCDVCAVAAVAVGRKEGTAWLVGRWWAEHERAPPLPLSSHALACTPNSEYLWRGEERRLEKGKKGMEISLLNVYLGLTFMCIFRRFASR